MKKKICYQLSLSLSLSLSRTHSLSFSFSLSHIHTHTHTHTHTLSLSLRDLTPQDAYPVVSLHDTWSEGKNATERKNENWKKKNFFTKKKLSEWAKRKAPAKRVSGNDQITCIRASRNALLIRFVLLPLLLLLLLWRRVRSTGNEFVMKEHETW